MQTLKQVENEALRRAKEDGYARIIYITNEDKFAIAVLTDPESEDIMEYPIGVAWPDAELEIFKSDSPRQN